MACAMARAGMDFLQTQTLAQLQTLPGVDAATARDLLRLGVASLDDLSRRDPHELHDRLNLLDGQRHGPDVLATFAAAIHAARTGEARPWWEFSDARQRAEDSVLAGRRPLPRFY
jgi:hypothetical protein